jgi:LPXTG-motif cell wall-anchored protein
MQVNKTPELGFALLPLITAWLSTPPSAPQVVYYNPNQGATGNTGNTGLYVGIGVAALAGVALLAVAKKKRKKR